MNKTCSKCSEEKLVTAFYHSKTGTYGRDAYCIECRKANNKTYTKPRDRTEYFRQYNSKRSK